MIAANVSGKEGFASTMRGLSHKKRSGVLQLDVGGTSVSIRLREGRIVEVESAGLSASLKICNRLCQGGFLKKQVLGVVQETPISVRQLGQVLVEKGYLVKDTFVQAKGAYEVELLHETFRNAAGDFKFTPKLVNDDGALALNLWPTQFLLDAVEYSADNARFEELFGGFSDSDVRVIQIEPDELPTLTEEEKLVLSLCEQEIAPSQIYDRSLLSRDKVQLALLTLLDQELIEVLTLSDPDQALFPNAEVGDSPYPESSEQSVLYGLVESAAEKLQEIQEQDFDTDESAGTERVVEVMSEAAGAGFEEDLLPEQDEVEPLPLLGVELEEDTAGADAELVAEVSHPVSESENDVRNTQTASVSSARHARAAKEKPSLNKLLLQEDMSQKIVMGVTLAFLLSFAFIGADLLESWFAALSEFTSNT